MLQYARAPFCPRCLNGVGSAERCEPCQLSFRRDAGVLDFIGLDEREERAAGVEKFYTKSPFPGYAPGDDGPTLMDRCRQSWFLAALDGALPADARVLDAGCGTAQIPAFLALAAPRRQVLGIDGCRASLLHADEFRQRAGIENLQLARADLFNLPVEPESFHFVNSRGVVHHTPDPDRAIACVARCVAPGGILLLGFYETMGRLFHCTRRTLGKLTRKPVRMLDPVLRRRDLDEEKKRIWIDDQYYHPLEHILPLPHVIEVLRGLGFRWVRSVPPACEGNNLFDPTPEPSPAALRSLRLGWAWMGLNDPDAGLVCVIAQRDG